MQYQVQLVTLQRLPNYFRQTQWIKKKQGREEKGLSLVYLITTDRKYFVIFA